MMLGRNGSRNVSITVYSTCIAVLCGMVFVASGLMAEDRLGARPASDGSVELLQSIESNTTPPSATGGGVPEQTTHQSNRTFDDLDTAASGLNDALDGARSKLDQLREAANIAAIAAALRDELEAAAEENNRLASALTKAEVTQRSLETSLEKSGNQAENLNKELKESRSEANDLAQRLRNSRSEAKSIDVARGTAIERAERAENQLAASQDQNQAFSEENKALKDKLKVARLERDDARVEIELTRQERDDAHQELDTIRLRIAGLLRSVLHADEAFDAAASPERAALASPGTAAEAESAGRAYKVIQTSNIRAEPHRDAKRVDIGITGENVSVLRKVPNDNWFEVKTVRGTTGYIFGELIEPAS